MVGERRYIVRRVHIGAPGLISEPIPAPGLASLSHLWTATEVTMLLGPDEASPDQGYVGTGVTFNIETRV